MPFSLNPLVGDGRHKVTPAFPQIFDVPETVGELGIFFPTGHRTILSAAVWPRGYFGYKKYTLARMLQG